MTKREYLPSVRLILGILKVTLMIVLGSYILLSSTFDHLPKYFRTIFAVVVIVYGIYRLISILRKYIKQAA